MRRARVLWSAALAGVLVVTVAGCGSDDSGGSSTTSSRASTSSESLTGTRWQLRDASDLPTNGVAVTAEFADGTMSGSSGCNTYRASYTTEGSDLTIGPDIATTQIACEAGPGQVETAYLQRLPRVRSYEIDGRSMVLRDAEGAALLVYGAVDGGSVILGSWVATGYYTGSAIQSVAGDTELTATFEGTRLSGDGGCNGFSGSFETTGDSISIGPLASTMRACADPELQTQEQQYLAALELASTFRVTGDRLELVREDGGFAATFERAAD